MDKQDQTPPAPPAAPATAPQTPPAPPSKGGASYANLEDIANPLGMINARGEQISRLLAENAQFKERLTAQDGIAERLAAIEQQRNAEAAEARNGLLMTAAQKALADAGVQHASLMGPLAAELLATVKINADQEPAPALFKEVAAQKAEALKADGLLRANQAGGVVPSHYIAPNLPTGAPAGPDISKMSFEDIKRHLAEKHSK